MGKLLFLDFESYYDQEYSLKKMAPPNYILDSRWETIGCAVKVDQGPSHFVDGPDFASYISAFDPAETTTVAFNALFDNCVLAWRYGFVPARMLCTMRMAVALRGHLLSGASLATVGKFLGVGTKGTAIQDACGKHRADLMASPGLWRAYQAYANNDNEMNADILSVLWPEFPTTERRVMDKVLKCAVDPRFVIDTKLLEDHLKDLDLSKFTMIAEAAGDPDADPTDQAARDKCDAFAKSLRSNAKFEELLKSHGVDIEYKPSQTGGPDIPAFAKTDEFMADLQEHEDPIVQALACARLGLRSTIEESRGKRLMSIAQLPWENYHRGNSTAFYSQYSLPIPLRYSGAHTHRLSGDWLMNMQNLPSGRGKQKSKLRKAVKAPASHTVVVADLAQIECRINAWLCGQKDLLALFASGGDPYSVLASAIFGMAVDKKTGNGIYRFIGKSGELGLGFGCGDTKFYNMVVRSARVLGMDVNELLKVWTPTLATKSVQTYRQTHAHIRDTWGILETHLRGAWLGKTLPVRFGPCTIGHGYVEGPSGLRMNYGNPREEGGELWYTYGRRNHKIYGSKFLENIVQFLARIVLMNAGLRIADRTKVDFSLQAHDELVWIVPDAAGDVFMQIVKQEMVRRPSWAKDIPLDAEVGSGPSYGDAK